jgi:hypothetical protein
MSWWDTFTKGVTDYITTGSTGNTFADFATRTGLGYALSKTNAGDSPRCRLPRRYS